MKNLNKILIIIASVLVIALVVFITLRLKKNNSLSETNNLENLTTSATNAQSYVAPKAPSLKDGDKILGSSKANLKIFVYEDNSNTYSAQLADTLDKIYSNNSSDLAIIIRPFISKNSSLAKDAALAVECAGDQNKWVAMRALLFAKTKNASLTPADFTKYSDQIGLDQNAFSACLTNQEKSAKIEGLSQEAETYNVIGAPTIFIGDEMIPGARPYEDYVDSNGDKIEGLKTIVEKKINKI